MGILNAQTETLLNGMTGLDGSGYIKKRLDIKCTMTSRRWPFWIING